MMNTTNFRMFTDQKSHSAAEAACQSIGAYLGVIDEFPDETDAMGPRELSFNKLGYRHTGCFFKII